MDDIRVVYLDLDPATKCAVVLDSEDNCTIVVNNLYNNERQREAVAHEVRRLLRGLHRIEGGTIQGIEDVPI